MSLTEVPMNPQQNRDGVTQLILGTFNVLVFQVADQAVLSPYTLERAIGIVLNSSDGDSHFSVAP